MEIATDMKNTRWTDKMDKAHFWWAVGLSIFGCLLLIIALFMPVVGQIEASVVTAVGLVFTFSGTIVGINGSVNTKLAKFQQGFEQKQDDEGE